MSLPSMYSDGHGHAMERGIVGRVRTRLSARSRVTNLGVVLLSISLFFSVLMNLHRPRPVIVRPVQTDGEHKYPTTFANTQKVLPALPGQGKTPLTHLVLVAGHAIWRGNSSADIHGDKSWVLEDYQYGQSTNTFVKHIQAGYVPTTYLSIDIAANDSASLLIFSGGQSRDQAWLTEAESYLHLALNLPNTLPTWSKSALLLAAGKHAFEPLLTKKSAGENAFKASTTSAPHEIDTSQNLAHLRITTENFALDSFQNLLFSVARFHEYTGKYPEKITVVGYKFKEKRYKALHARAIRWPLHKPASDGSERFTYVGIDDELGPGEEPQRDNAYELFDRDLYGCQHKLLQKRRARNSARRLPPYTSTAQDIAGLLDWCPPNNSALQGLYPFWLPWDRRVDNGLGRGAQSAMQQNGGRIVQAEILPDGKRIA